MYFSAGCLVVGSRHRDDAGKMNKGTQDYYPDNGHYTRKNRKKLSMYISNTIVSAL